MRKIWNIITTVIVVAAVILAVLLVGVRLLGLQVFSVLSPSMEPTYHVGSLIYVKQAGVSELDVGDAITFRADGGTIVTHKIIEVIEDEDGAVRYRTQGEANDTPDGGSVTYQRVIGKPVFTVPYLGYFASYISQAPGKYVAIAVSAVLLVLIFIPEFFKNKKTKDDI